jgi:hypothetical protein
MKLYKCVNADIFHFNKNSIFIFLNQRLEKKSRDNLYTMLELKTLKILELDTQFEFETWFQEV